MMLLKFYFRAKPLNISELTVHTILTQTKQRSSEQLVKRLLDFSETWEAHSEKLDELNQAWQNN